MNIRNFLQTMPRWYKYVLVVLFICYLGGWAYTVHLAQVERASGAAYVLPVGPSDSTSYANLSQSVLQGHFAEPGEQYEYFHTPGYPAFVAAILFVTGGSYFAVTLIQILLVFAIALMTMLLGSRLASPKVGQWASLLFLVNPLVPSIALYILTDILFTFLLTLGFTLMLVYFTRKPLAVALGAGIIFAAAAYVRPIGFIAYPILLAPLLALAYPWRKKILYGVVMLAVVSVLLVPWMLRNKADSGVFAFSSLVPLDMAYYNIPHFYSSQTGISIGDGIAKVEQQSGVPRGNDALGYPRNWYDLAYSPKLNTFYKHVLLTYPVSYTVWHLYNSLGFFVNSAINPPHQTQNIKQLLVQGHIKEAIGAILSPWWLFAERILVGIGLLLALAGIWRLRRNWLTWAFVFVILYLAALGGPSSQARYRLPVEPILSIFMVVGSGIIMTNTSNHAKGKKGIVAWIMRSPMFAGLRGTLGGRAVIRAINAKRGDILYYNEQGRGELYEKVRKIKWEVRTVISDTEAMILYTTVASLEKVPGAIAEVGVYKGGSTRLLAEASKGTKEIYAFDTFEGLPETESFDDKRFSAGQFATPFEEVQAYLKPYPQIHLYKGLFPETAGPVKDKKFSFVHLDVDIYTSTKDSLDFFYPRLNSRGILISHDHSNTEGVQRAFEEFFSDKPEVVISLPGTQCLVVKQ